MGGNTYSKENAADNSKPISLSPTPSPPPPNQYDSKPAVEIQDKVAEQKEKRTEPRDKNKSTLK